MTMMIGVGGTGQHVGLTYLYLAQLAGFEPVPVLIVDNDNTSEVPQKIAEVKSWFGGQPAQPVRPLPDGLGPDPSPTSQFRHEQDLLHLFYEKEEHRGNLNDGFFGCPHVGATFGELAFAQNGGGGFPKAMQEVRERLNTLPEGKRRLVLVSSITGGCGSGVLPRLLKNLEQIKGEVRCTIQAGIALRVFQLVGDPPADRAIGPRKLSLTTFEQNVATGLEFFRTDLSSLCERVLLVATPDTAVESRQNAGDVHQPADPVYTDVVSAAVQHLFLTGANGNRDLDTKFRVFSTGPGRLSIYHIPVPGGGLEFQMDSLDLDTFTFKDNNQGKIGGRQSANLLDLPSTLGHWLWISRIQRELLEAAAEGVSGGKWDARTDLRDVLRGTGIAAKEVHEHLIAQEKRIDDAIEWIRKAFLRSGDGRPVRRGAVAEGTERELLDLDPAKDRRDWNSTKGKGLGKRLEMILEEAFTPSGAVWKYSDGLRSIRGARGFAEEIGRRCRDVAGRIVWNQA